MGRFSEGAPVAVCAQTLGGTISQTDLFVTDPSGRLYVFWTDPSGNWSGPGRVGFDYPDSSTAPPPGARLAAAAGDSGDSAVFYVSNAGQLTMYWVQNAGAWQGPVAIGPAGRFAPGAGLTVARQGATRQFDAFLIDINGDLVVFWGLLVSGWNGPKTIGEKIYVLAKQTGPGVATLLTANSTSLLAVDDTGDLNAYSVVGSDPWSPAQLPNTQQRSDVAAPPAVTPLFGTQTAVALLVDRDGGLVRYAQDENGEWSGPFDVRPNFTTRGAVVATSQQYGVGAQTDAFVVDPQGRLNVFWTGSDGVWNGPEPIGPAGLLTPASSLAASAQFGSTSADGLPDRTDVFAISKDGDPVVFTVLGAGKWTWSKITLDKAPRPSTGLGSNSNYLFANDTGGLIGLRASVDVTADVVSTGDSLNQPGFSIQLNLLDPSPYTASIQQYIFAIQNNELWVYLDWWDKAGLKKLGWSQRNVGKLAVANTLQSGSKLEFVLSTDTQNRVTDVQFIYVDPEGKPGAPAKLHLLNASWSPTVATTGLAPCNVGQIAIVGVANTAKVNFKSGAGIISFSQSNNAPITALSSLPPGLSWTNFLITAETSNMFYGPMEAGANPSLAQNFGLSPIP